MSNVLPATTNFALLKGSNLKQYHLTVSTNSRKPSNFDI